MVVAAIVPSTASYSSRHGTYVLVKAVPPAHRQSYTFSAVDKKMLRRNVRLRKEYLYKKALEDKENSIRERKERVKHAVESGKVRLMRRAAAYTACLLFC